MQRLAERPDDVQQRWRLLRQHLGAKSVREPRRDHDHWVTQGQHHRANRYDRGIYRQRWNGLGTPTAKQPTALCVQRVGGSVNTVDSASALTAATRLHFALTRASDGTAVCFYVSGTLISTAVAGAAPSPSVTPTQLLLGGNLSGGDLSGVLDEVGDLQRDGVPRLAHRAAISKRGQGMARAHCCRYSINRSARNRQLTCPRVSILSTVHRKVAPVYLVAIQAYAGLSRSR